MAKVKDDVVVMDEEEVKGNKSAEKKGEAKKNVPITLDNSVEEVVKLNKESRVTLFFDPNSFLRLPDEVVNDLSFYSAQSYFQAKTGAEAEERRREQERPVSFDELKISDPLSGSQVNKLKLRERSGWHQTWKRPDEFEVARDQGYRQIREVKKSSEDVGQETGEVKKIYDENGKVELIAMEIPMEVVEQHNIAVSNRVRYRKGEQLEKMNEQADRASHAVGKKGSIKVKDFSNDDSEKWRDIQ